MASTKTIREAFELAQVNADRTGIPWCIFRATGRYYVETVAPSGLGVHWCNPTRKHGPAPEYRALLDASDIKES